MARPSLTPRSVFRFLFTALAAVLGLSMILTMLTPVHAASCEESTDSKRETKTTGAVGLAPASASIYLEIMSGDVKLNARLRERMEAKLTEVFPKATLVDRAARHAPKGAVGVRLTVRSWAPRWTPLWSRAVHRLETEVRYSDNKGKTTATMTGEASAICVGIVNQDTFFEDDADHIVAWAWEQLALERLIAPGG